MNAIRQTALLNKRELENAIPPSASWHVDYRDTAWIYVGGLPLDLSEGDVVTIFSQFGNPTHLNMIRDKETGKTKGFGFLKYEDQRSCDLAVDNLGGADVLGRLLRVDHTRYKRREGEDEDTYRIEKMEAEASGRRASDTEDSGAEGRVKKRRKMLREESELQEMLAITKDGEEEDPMRGYLINEKREEAERARQKEEKRNKHKHRHHHRRKEDDGDHDDDDEAERRHRHKHRHRSASPGHVEDDRRPKHKRNGAVGRRPEETHRRRSRSRERDGNDYQRERRRPRSSRSPPVDEHRRKKDRSRSPKSRSRYDDSD